MKLMGVFSIAGVVALAAGTSAAQTIHLPSGKEIHEPVPGHPQRLNNLPMSMAISPDGRFVVTVNAGYGSAESNQEQSLAVFDVRSGAVFDYPDARTLVGAKQTLFSGLAFSHDGKHLYASMGSETDPIGNGKDATGSGIVVYSFANGAIAPERMIPLPLVQLAPGKKTKLIGEVDGDKGLPFPAAIVVTGSADLQNASQEKLLVAGNQSDDVWLIDAASGKIEKRFDLAESDAVPSTYPIALAVEKDGRRAFVALWNASEVVELDLGAGTVGRKLALLKPDSPTAPGTHPCALELTQDGRELYVALANRDAVAVLNVGKDEFSIKGYFDTRLPGQTYFGAEPDALALDEKDNRLFVSDSGIDAVAVIDTRKPGTDATGKSMALPMGFFPTEWMPISMAFLRSPTGKMLYVATAKGKGTRANGEPPPASAIPGTGRRRPRPYTYIATLLHGSLATINEPELERNLPQWTAAVIESNRMKTAAEKVTFAGAEQDRIKHVIYIIKENRTYDQILGDLKKDGKPVGNGDPSLTMYGQEITPNEHKLALEFGVLDNFYDSGDVSGNGHVWSNAAIGSDYLEKTWQAAYRGSERSYDFEGVVANDYPILQKIPDVNEPMSGYLWGNLAAHGKTYYHFGEFVATTFCGEAKVSDPQLGPLLKGHDCAHKAVAPGEKLPAEWGGEENKWAWPIPLVAANVATKPELVGHFAEEAPDFDTSVPDQIRVNIFERHLKGWVADKQQGKDTMPNFVMLRLGNDHTAGTTPGGPSPRSSVADNDLAVGRVADVISHSPFWDDTAIFMLEDDAQDGGDHVDAHRSLALVISKYAPRGAGGAPFVDSRFYTTVSVVRTMESLLGLPPMNNNDAFSPLIASLFAGPGDHAPYEADTSNRKNGLIYKTNPPHAPGGAASSRMDFRHADRADTRKLNVILWKDAMGNKPVPAMILKQRAKARKDDDD